MANAAVEIGRGAYGCVFLHRRGDQELVARKVFHREVDFDEEFEMCSTIVAAIDRLRLEGKAMRGAECLAIALDSTADEIIERRSLYFQLALYDLQAMVDGNQDQRRCAALTSVELVYGLIDDCLSGLEFLHEHARILHNDIKPQNVLYYADGRARLADFGMAKHIPWLSRFGQRLGDSRVGTVTVQAPEVWVDDYSADTRPDVFSLGVTLFTVLDGATLVKLSRTIVAAYNMWQAEVQHRTDASAQKRVFFNMMRCYFNDMANVSRFCRLPCGYNLKSPSLMTGDIAEVLRMMVCLDPSTRPCAKDALELLRIGRGAVESTTTTTPPVEAALEPPPVAIMAHSTPAPSLPPLPSTLKSGDDAEEPRLVCVSRVLDKYKISSQRVLAARTLVREAKHIVMLCMRENADADVSHVDDAEVAKLERRLVKRGEASEQHRAAQQLLDYVRNDRGKNNAAPSADETLLFAILQDDGFEVRPGGCNMNRYVFELLTKRGHNWWKKRSGPLRAKLLA